MVVFALPLSVMTGFAVSIKTLLNAMSASVTVSLLPEESCTVTEKLALPESPASIVVWNITVVIEMLVITVLFRIVAEAFESRESVVSENVIVSPCFARVESVLVVCNIRLLGDGGVVSTTFTVRTMLAGTFPARSAGALYSTRYDLTMYVLMSFALDDTVPLYFGSLSVMVAPASMYVSGRSMVMFALPLSVMTGFAVSIKMLSDVRFASVT